MILIAQIIYDRLKIPFRSIWRTNRVLEEIFFRNNNRFENRIAWIHSTNRERETGEKCFPSSQTVIHRRAPLFYVWFCASKKLVRGEFTCRELHEWKHGDSTKYWQHNACKYIPFAFEVSSAHNLRNEVECVWHHYHFNATVCRRNSLTTGQLSGVAH